MLLKRGGVFKIWEDFCREGTEFTLEKYQNLTSRAHPSESTFVTQGKYHVVELRLKMNTIP